MPNGGYPMHYLMHIPGTDFTIHADGATVHIERFIESRTLPSGETRPQYEEISTLTNAQICGLLYHLNYWGIDTSAEQVGIHGDTFNGKIIEPQYRNNNCAYDY